jgi:hypothetical protein
MKDTRLARLFWRLGLAVRLQWPEPDHPVNPDGTPLPWPPTLKMVVRYRWRFAFRRRLSKNEIWCWNDYHAPGASAFTDYRTFSQNWHQPQRGDVV